MDHYVCNEICGRRCKTKSPIINPFEKQFSWFLWLKKPNSEFFIGFWILNFTLFFSLLLMMLMLCSFIVWVRNCRSWYSINLQSPLSLIAYQSSACEHREYLDCVKAFLHWKVLRLCFDFVVILFRSRNIIFFYLVWSVRRTHEWRNSASESIYRIPCTVHFDSGNQTSQAPKWWMIIKDRWMANRRR